MCMQIMSVRQQRPNQHIVLIDSFALLVTSLFIGEGNKIWVAVIFG